MSFLIYLNLKRLFLEISDRVWDINYYCKNLCFLNNYQKKNYQNNEDHWSDKTEDEIVIRSEPTMLFSAVAEGIDYARDGDYK